MYRLKAPGVHHRRLYPLAGRLLTRQRDNRYREELGVAQGRKFVDLDEYLRYEGADGHTLILYTDLDRLEKHLLEFSPRDTALNREFTQGIRLCLVFVQPSAAVPLYRCLYVSMKPMPHTLPGLENLYLDGRFEKLR